MELWLNYEEVSNQCSEMTYISLASVLDGWPIFLIQNVKINMKI